MRALRLPPFPRPPRRLPTTRCCCPTLSTPRQWGGRVPVSPVWASLCRLPGARPASTEGGTSRRGRGRRRRRSVAATPEPEAAAEPAEEEAPAGSGGLRELRLFEADRQTLLRPLSLASLAQAAGWALMLVNGPELPLWNTALITTASFGMPLFVAVYARHYVCELTLLRKTPHPFPTLFLHKRQASCG